jgi:putative ABC transport system substrate-binding protein
MARFKALSSILLALVWCGVIAATVSYAQQKALPKVGFLALARFVPPQLLLEDLAKQGFVDGKNMSIEYHFADGRHEQMRSLASNLVRNKVDVLCQWRSSRRRRDGGNKNDTDCDVIV